MNSLKDLCTQVIETHSISIQDAEKLARAALNLLEDMQSVVNISQYPKIRNFAADSIWNANQIVSGK